jgi:hypothetical protein
MAAIRITDDHFELTNIGTNTHAQIDAHIIDPSAHHTKYTNAEAIAAVLADDKYLKNTGDLATGKITISADSLEDTGSGLFHLVEQDDATRFRAITYSSTNWHSPTFVFARSRGTAAARLYPTVNNEMYQILSQGWSESTNSWKTCANLLVVADGNWSAGYYPGRIEFRVGTDGNVYPKLTIKSDGKVGVNTTTPTAQLDIYSDILRLRTAKTPASAGAAGNQGDICWDADYIYVCTATNTWKRTAISTW